ncbi:zinc-binding dehydrogenase [Noviherbaspirillum sedimenti]|uniref:Alcohol dehydrogenase n=1 Tax=Noviherbaspirillum sedimenti TaxID=2320865 RepID=A0A3A3GGZ8_9BURK|nr:zinc-binding dehydrogenase [Noviherbaspirillum sedimenti]RJG00180.1 alcohol dehydrogenase [Noviherbaspirillum sedimenti]
MKAIVIVQKAGQPSSLEYQTVADPVLQPTELLVSVKAAGINRIDLMRSTSHGTASAGEPQIAGLEVAGEVIAVGADVHGFVIGDRIMAMTRSGYAELAAVDYRVAMKLPTSFSYDEGAAIATVYPTAHDALVVNGRFAAGKSVLIHGVSSAVGLATVQIAKALGAGIVIGTARSTGKAAMLAGFGLEHFVDLDSGDLTSEIMRLTSGKGVDVVVDMVGSGVLAANLACMALGGYLVSVGRMGGTKDSIDLDLLALKRLSLIGVSFRMRSVEEKAALFARFREDIFPLFDAGLLRPHIERVYPLAQAEQAQADMASNCHFGKLILQP